MSFALLCPGQGAQTPEFIRQTLSQAPPWRHALEQVLGLSPGGLDALSVESLRANDVAQPCIMACELAIWSGLAPHLPRPALAAGYSLGEVIAWSCASSMGAQDALWLAQQRARMMDLACEFPCSMLALRGLPVVQVQEIAARFGFYLAIRNSEDRFVVAGPAHRRAELESHAMERGASATRVEVATPSHTPLLASAVAPFGAALSQVLASPMAFPVISALDGALQRQHDAIMARLPRQLSEPLDWAGVMDTIAERGIRVCLELGPGMDLARMLRERHPTIAVRAVQEFSNVTPALSWVREQLGC